MPDPVATAFDRFGRRHPAVTFFATLLMAAAAMLALLAQSESTAAILYEGF